MSNRVSNPLSNGTSPRARGKLVSCCPRSRLHRNIPACAGKTQDQYFFASCCGEHPRVRGENDARAVYHAAEEGTSPRARGKLSIAEPFCRGKRNIPACAGKTVPHCGRTVINKEHPRVRGENGCLVGPPWTFQGTSPRARGKLRSTGQCVVVSRNIPACAGKTLWGHCPVGADKEHPRVRGENLDEFFPAFGFKGTSPRARGKHGMSTWCSVMCGNIPACAGKTTGVHRRCRRDGEHPRVRGENGGEFFGERRGAGTSPRARGKPAAHEQKISHPGNIPACAGKTAEAREKKIGMLGTSPRARGKPWP